MNSSWRGTSYIPLTHELRLSGKMNKPVNKIIKVTAFDGTLFPWSGSRITDGHTESSDAGDEDTDRKNYFQ